jgi:hypothetical protein
MADTRIAGRIAKAETARADAVKPLT